MRTKSLGCEPSLKQLVYAVGGPREGHENQKGYFRRVALMAGIEIRMVCAVFYGEVNRPDHWAIKLLEHAAREKDEGRARNEYAELLDRIALLESRMAAIDPEFFGAQAAAIRSIPGAAGRNGGPVDSLTRQAIDYLDSQVNSK